jgi:hypothetical protein
MEALVERLAPKVTEYQLALGVGYGQGNDPAVTDVPRLHPFVRTRWITADRTYRGASRVISVMVRAGRC